MSHFKERAEKICLNCNAELSGRYCHVCGQENREPKETVWGLITHFFYDITHFDGKFFASTGKLIGRPGLLPKEYIEGKRQRYINPIRMYIFSSALFFIIFYSLLSGNDFDSGNKYYNKMDSASVKSMERIRDIALQNATTYEDSAAIEKVFTKAKNNGDIPEKKDSTDTSTVEPKKKKNGKWNYSFSDPAYKSREEYDSVQKTLPAGERDNWFERLMNYRTIELHQRYNDDNDKLEHDLFEKFMHTFPYLLFVSLPLYALYLKLLYIRRGKQFYYVDHGIFLIYLYIYTFIFLLVFFALDKLRQSLDWDWVGYIEFVMIIYGIYYANRAMRKFYGQGRWKTFLKFILLNILSFISILILFSIFFILTVFWV